MRVAIFNLREVVVHGQGPTDEGVLMPMLEKYDVVVVEDADGLIHW